MVATPAASGLIFIVVAVVVTHSIKYGEKCTSGSQCKLADPGLDCRSVDPSKASNTDKKCSCVVNHVWSSRKLECIHIKELEKPENQDKRSDTVVFTIYRR
jgi:hypothetical protein